MREEERIPVPDWLRFLSLSLSCPYYLLLIPTYYYKLISQLIKEVTVSMHHCTDSLMVRSQTARASVECEGEQHGRSWNSSNRNLKLDSLRADFVPQV